MKKDEQSTVLTKEVSPELKALVALEDRIAGNEAAMAIQNDPDMLDAEKLEIITGMLDGVEDQMEGVPPKPPKCELSEKGYTFEEAETISEFEAIILYSFRVNAFFLDQDDSKIPIDFKIPKDTNRKPPFCSSAGPFKGSKSQIKVVSKRTGEEVRVFGLCDQYSRNPACFLNNFGSDIEGNRKACGNKWWVFLWRRGDEKPHFLQLPASSLKEYNQYLTMLTKAKTAVHTVWTSFRYKKDDDGGSRKWGVFTYGPYVKIDNEEIEIHRTVNGFRNEIQKMGYKDNAATFMTEVDET